MHVSVSGEADALLPSSSSQRWHEDYSLFRKVSIYLLTGLELYQNRK